MSLRLLLVIAILVVGMGASLRSRFTALLLYLWFAFFRPQEWVFVDIASLRLSFIIAGMLVIPSILTGWTPDFRHPISKSMIVLVLAGFIAELATPVARTDWFWLQHVAQLALVSLLLVTLVNTPERLRQVALVIACSFGFHTAKAGLAFLISPGFRLIDGSGGSFPDNNSFGVAAAMIGFLLLALSAAARTRWERGALAVMGLLSLVTVVSTYSRGGFLSIGVGIAAFGLLSRQRFRLATLAIVAVVFILPSLPLPKGYVNRLRTIQTPAQESSAAGRLHFWQVALVMSDAQPLGVGINNFNQLYDRYDFSDGAFGTERSVHNSHLQVLTEAGFLGFAAWLFVLAYSVAVALRVRRLAMGAGAAGPHAPLYLNLARGLIAAIAAFIVGGTFTAIAWNDLTWCLLATLAAMDRVCRVEAAAHEPIRVQSPALQPLKWRLQP